MSSVYLLIFVYIGIPFYTEARYGNGLNLLRDLVKTDSVASAECREAERQIEEWDLRTVVDSEPRLTGQWVSQRCETDRDGHFLLRSLTFNHDLQFKLMRFFYNDTDCSLPVFTTTLKGRMHRRSYKFIEERLTIIPYSQYAIQKFEKIQRKSCKALYRRQGQNKDHQFVYYAEGGKRRTECYKALSPYLMRDSSLPRTLTREGKQELLLRNNSGGRRFVDPLIHLESVHETFCPVCRKIFKSSQHTPPILKKTLPMPSILRGTWISQVCEPMTDGSYLKRRVTFNGETWMEEARYFVQPSCSEEVAVVRRGGSYKAVGKSEFSGYESIRLSEDCGVDTSSSKRCRYSEDSRASMVLVKLSLSSAGAPELLLARLSNRSISFQPPLMQCSIFPIKP